MWGSVKIASCWDRREHCAQLLAQHGTYSIIPGACGQTRVYLCKKHTLSCCNSWPSFILSVFPQFMALCTEITIQSKINTCKLLFEGDIVLFPNLNQALSGLIEMSTVNLDVCFVFSMKLRLLLHIRIEAPSFLLPSLSLGDEAAFQHVCLKAPKELRCLTQPSGSAVLMERTWSEACWSRWVVDTGFVIYRLMLALLFTW